MCDFCHQHGEGKKWYLTMRNYSQELLAQNGRREFIANFLKYIEEEGGKALAKLDEWSMNPAVYRYLNRLVLRVQKRDHFGQVVPIEDVDQIIDLQDSIVRLPCVCRSLTTGRQARYCFGIGASPAGSLENYPDYSEGLEVLNKEEAKTLLRKFDKQGLVHSIWTFKTPYIGGICNCDQDCLAYRVEVKTKLAQTMFRAEYVGLVNWDLCTGCKRCISSCQFGAIHYSNSMEKTTIEMMNCYGCGVCRAVCAQNAIALKPRTKFLGLPISNDNRTKTNIKINSELCGNPLDCRLCLDRCPEKVFGTYPRKRRKPGVKADDWTIFPLFSSQCTKCMECISFCPKHAISVV
ncbi:MAG: 4Fe-4S dicluster domain-containing protein [bacterium]|nr:4Fe-4S dicluster domain-containing protein [bacterium]